MAERSRLTQQMATLEQAYEAQRLYVLERLRVIRATLAPFTDSGEDVLCSLDHELAQIQAELRR